MIRAIRTEKGGVPMRHVPSTDLLTIKKVVLLGVTSEELLPLEAETLRKRTTEDFVLLRPCNNVMDRSSFKHWIFSCENLRAITVFIIPNKEGLYGYKEVLDYPLKNNAQVLARITGRLVTVHSIFPRIEYQYLEPA